MRSTSSKSSSSGGKTKRGCLPLVMLFLSIGSLGCFFDAGDPSTYLDPSYLLFPIITIVLFIVHRRKKRKNSAQCTHNTISDSPAVTAGEAISKKVSFDDAVIDSLTQQFVAFDIETTGLSPTNDRIVELGAVLFCNGEPVRQFTTLVNPGIPIPASATAVNHITNRMLSSAPTEQEAYPQLIEFLGDALQGEIIMCAHNASFDFNFLCNTLSRLGYDATFKYVDTLYLSRKYIFGLPDYKQSTLEQHFGLTNPTAHRASTDAENCGKILCHILDIIESTDDAAIKRPSIPNPSPQPNIPDIPKCTTSPTKPLPDISRAEVTIDAKHTRIPLEQIQNQNEWRRGFEKGFPFWERGEEERKSGNIDNALLFFDTARQYGYLSPALYTSYALAYRKLKDYDNEIVILDEGIQRLPGNSEALEERRKKAIYRLYKKQKAEQQAEEKMKEKPAPTSSPITMEQKENQPNTISCTTDPGAIPVKTILQLSDDGTVIKEYISVAEASRVIGVSTKSIRCAATGVQKHAGGYRWQYKETEKNQ